MFICQRDFRCWLLLSTIWALLLVIQYQGNLELSIIGPNQGCSIVVGLVLMAITRIFEYGCILQEQDDRLL